ncbi:MAG: hypothetical protein ACRDJE_07340 [Dehalococcoidia bacterium]
MTTPSDQTGSKTKSDGNWAPLVEKLQTSGMPPGAPDLVKGRRLVGPLQGFGKMWQKTYRIALADCDVAPADVIRVWKEEFPSFWPKGNRFYAPLTGISPGEVALIQLSAGPMKLSTGVMVLYSDAESFTLMTPQGHMFAGWITFSSFEEADQCIAQVHVLMRAQDPLSELGLMFGGHKAEDRFWSSTLRALAARFGSRAEPQITVTCVDPRRRWAESKNVWHNAGIRSSVYVAGSPLRLLTRPFRRSHH